MTPPSTPFVFFGTDAVATGVLETLKEQGLLPVLIVTNPDAPAGRTLTLTAPPAKRWAETNNVPILQPTTLDRDFCHRLQAISSTLFVVASYGKIIPKKALALPTYGTLNVHPSLLPAYRGPSPIQTAIINGDTETGVTIMVMNEKMDEGPILTVDRVPLTGDETNEQLEETLSAIGGTLLATCIPEWVAQRIAPFPQNHDRATYTRKFEKQDGFIHPDLLNLHKIGSYVRFNLTEVEEAERKVRALSKTPGTYTTLKSKNNKELRLKIVSATIENDSLLPLRVIPEGKKEMSWDDFVRGFLYIQKG
jgi:methionyl-tRNA formyltransferase